MPKIFISYRRIDSQAMASLIYRSLVQKYKKQNVFLDTTTITSGKWWEQIQQALDRADVVIVVVGPKWESEIQKRLDHPDDFVREEVKLAIDKKKLIMLAFVDGVKGLDTSLLPVDIQDLSSYQAFEILHNPFYDASIDRLISNIPKHQVIYKMNCLAIIAFLIAFIVVAMIVSSMIDPLKLVLDHTPSLTITTTPLLPSQIVTDDLENLPIPITATNPSMSQTVVPLRPKDSTPMLLVPAGCFMMGSDPTTDLNAQADEQPAHQVCITQDFWIDQFEVTNEAFQQFIDDGGYSNQAYWSNDGWQWIQTSHITEPKMCNASAYGTNNLPRVGISWYEAQAYAKWRGGRLPTEAEWEYAARGADATIYPWANTYAKSRANINKGTADDQLQYAMPVKSFANGVSWINVYHLAGNVSEWVMDMYDANYYEQSIQDDPLNNPINSEGTRVLRGGSWADNEIRVRSAFRFQAPPNIRECTYGFRIVLPQIN